MNIGLLLKRLLKEKSYNLFFKNIEEYCNLFFIHRIFYNDTQIVQFLKPIHTSMKTSRYLLWLMFMLSPVLFFTGCEDNAEPNATIEGTVSGVLQDEEGYAVPEATVAALDAQNVTLASATTDEEGIFSFVLKGADENTLKVRISGRDFKTFEESFKSFIQKHGTDGKKDKIKYSMRHDDSACGKINIIVRDSTDGSVMNNVQVKLRREGKHLKTVHTDSSGRVLINYVPQGTYNLRFAKDGFKVLEPNVTVGGNCDSVNLLVWMKRTMSNGDSCCNSKIILYAKDSTNSTPIQNATIKLWLGNVLKQTKVTEQNGRIIFENLCPGDYSISMIREGYAGKEFNIGVGCNQTIELTKKLLSNGGNNNDSCCNSKIKLYLNDSTSNAALKGVRVKLSQGGTVKQTKESNDNGYIAFENLCPGTYALHILFEKEGYFPWTFEFQATVGCNQTLELTKKVFAKKKETDSCCNSKIILYSKDSTSSAPIQNAMIKLWQGNTLKLTKTSDANGRVAFEKLCPGNYSISMIREGYQGREFNLTVGCNQTIELTKKLLKTSNNSDSCCTAQLKLRMKDSTNFTYIEGAHVVIRNSNQQVIREGNSGAEGWAFFGELCAPATYYVTVSKQGYGTKSFTFTYNECKILQETIWLKQ
jgi:hypothetical protein